MAKAGYWVKERLGMAKESRRRKRKSPSNLSSSKDFRAGLGKG